MAKDFREHIDKIWDIYEFEEWSEEDQTSLREEVVQLYLAHETELNGVDYHQWGLFYYFSDYEKDKYVSMAIPKFEKALSMDNSLYFARLYLAHSHHDLGNLKMALEHYVQVDQPTLKEYQFWRYVKLREQIGHCHYKLGDQALGEQYFEEVLNHYREAEFGDLAVPSEFMDCLPDDHPFVIEMKTIETYLK